MKPPNPEQPLSPGEGVVLVVVLVLFFSWGLLPIVAEFVGAYRVQPSRQGAE